jgi:hypothetical protein
MNLAFYERQHMRTKVEELQAARAVEAQKVWDFLGQTETVLGTQYGRWASA